MHSSTSELLAGGGELGALMRQTDWAASPLGPVTGWPEALKTAVRILLTSRQPMFVWWGNDLINLYNDAYRSILGGKHPWALGAPAREVWREIWSDVGPRARSAMIENEGTYDEALELIMERNGYPEETYYTFSYSPIPNDKGGTGGIICANTDDTQRIIGERRLALLRELAAQTAEARTVDEACRISARCFETNPRDLPFALIYLVDDDHRTVALKGAAGIERRREASPESAAIDAQTVWPFARVLAENKPVVLTDLADRFADLPMGAWQQRPNSAVAIPVSTSGKKERAGVLIAGLNPFRLFDDSYEGFFGLIASQISAALGNAHAYDEERKRAEELAELDRAKTMFFSNVSHEFRTPLMLMLAPVEDALQDTRNPLPPTQRDRITLVERNGARMLKLVNTLLDFSRIEAGRVEAAYQRTDLSTYTADLASLFRSAVERADMQLIVDCQPGVEASVDREMWEKIVLNLLSNAFKYTFEGSISVSLDAQEGTVRLSVTDTGIGIAADQIGRLFDRFHRIEGARGRTFEGTGIGLALVQELTRLHGGKVTVESVAGKGSTFRVEIPVGNFHLAQGRRQPERELNVAGASASAYVEEALRWLPAEESGAVSVSPESAEVEDGEEETRQRILLADDNADMRGYVARLLRERFRVDTVANGRDALEAIRNNPPDLILSDVMMPELDGFGLVQAIRADMSLRTLPVILISARAGEEATVEGLSHGADDYLVKPFTARELIARVTSNLKLAALRAEALAAQLRVAEVLETISDAFISLDADWRYTYFNRMAASMAKREADEMVGKVLWEEFPETRNSPLYESLHKVMMERQPAHFDYYYAPTDVWTQWRAYPTGNGISAIIADVTEKKKLEEQLRQSAKLESLGILAGGVAHDFNNLLVGVMGNASLAEDMLPEGHEVRPMLREAVRASERAAELTQQLLAYSGKGRFVIEPVNLAEMVREDMMLLRTTSAANVELKLELPQSLPAIEADRTQIQQVVMNLMINAAEAIGTQPGRVRVRVSLRGISADDRELLRLGLEVGDYVSLEVRDNGCGMTAETQSRIFDPFFTTKFTGRGLGLAAVQGIVRGHRGAILVHSVPGEGTTFQVLIPAAAKPAPSRLKTRSQEDLAGSGTILIIDDDATVRQTASLALRARGYETLSAANGDEGVEVFGKESSSISAVILDMTMPVMTGELTLPMLKKIRPAVPVILSSGYAEAEVEVRFAGKAFDGFIQKPYTAGQLAKAVRDAIRDAGRSDKKAG